MTTNSTHHVTESPRRAATDEKESRTGLGRLYRQYRAEPQVGVVTPSSVFVTFSELWLHPDVLPTTTLDAGEDALYHDVERIGADMRKAIVILGLDAASSNE